MSVNTNSSGHSPTKRRLILVGMTTLSLMASRSQAFLSDQHQLHFRYHWHHLAAEHVLHPHRYRYPSLSQLLNPRHSHQRLGNGGLHRVQKVGKSRRAQFSFSRIRTNTKTTLPNELQLWEEDDFDFLYETDNQVMKRLQKSSRSTSADDYKLVVPDKAKTKKAVNQGHLKRKPTESSTSTKSSQTNRHYNDHGVNDNIPEQPTWILQFSAAQQQVDQWKRTVQNLINEPIVECAGAALILLSSILVATTTLPDVPRELLAPIETVQEVLAYLFLAEFLTRWFSSTEERGGRYITQPLVLVDIIVVVLPLLLTTFLGLVDLAFPDWLSGQSGLINLRLLRVLRLQRVLQDEMTFSRFVYAIQPGSFSSPAAIVQQWELQLARVVLSLFTLLSVAAGLIYTTEHSVNPNIGDYFTALYFTLTTLTTVGFGDITPITWQGKLVVSLSILAGITVIPAQAASLVEALLQRTEDKKRRLEEQQQRGRRSLRPQARQQLQQQPLLQQPTSMLPSAACATAVAGDTVTTSSSSTAAASKDATLQHAVKCPTCKVGLHWSHARYCYNCASPLYPEPSLILTES